MQVLAVVRYTSVVEQVTWQQGVWENSSTRRGEKIPSTDLEKQDTTGQDTKGQYTLGQCTLWQYTRAHYYIYRI